MDSQDPRQFMARYLEAVAVDFEGALEKYVADEGLIEHGRFFQVAFPGYRIEPIDTVVEGNKLVLHATFHGTHSGPGMPLEPTGKTVAVPFMMIYTIEAEQIVDHQFMTNEMELLRQLGALPTPAAA